MRSRIGHGIFVVPFLFMFVSSPAQASYAQFCRLSGDIVSHPEQTGCCVKFEFIVVAAAPYIDPLYGDGWGRCDEHLGSPISVQIATEFLGKQEFSLGQTKTIWRDAMDMEINGEMCTVVGFSAVEPTK